jgi:hypothetical protein
MTVWLDQSAPLGECTVDLTPRRCQAFRAKPGQRFQWANTRLSDNRAVGAGSVSGDEWGLVTIKQLSVNNSICKG